MKYYEIVPYNILLKMLILHYIDKYIEQRRTIGWMKGFGFK